MGITGQISRKLVQSDSGRFIVWISLAEIINITDQVIQIVFTIFNIDFESRIDNFGIIFAILITVLSEENDEKVTNVGEVFHI